MDTDVGSASNQIYQVTDLTPETVLAVAKRLDRATTFADLIYRESEIDALWSLVDIQVRNAELAQSAELPKWQTLRTRLWEAHDLVPEHRCPAAATILRELVELL